MTKLESLLEEMRENNVDYLSDTSMKWIYSQLRTLKNSDRQSIKEEIVREVENVVFRKGRFYYFDYLPTKRRNDAYESFDRRPLILFLAKRDKLIYGLNLNYLRIDRRYLFLNKCFRYLVGDMKDQDHYADRLALDYLIMNKNNTFIEQKVIFRKYLINRMKNLRMIPLNKIKIFASLNNVAKFPIGEDKIHVVVMRKMKEEITKRYNGLKKTI